MSSVSGGTQATNALGDLRRRVSELETLLRETDQAMTTQELNVHGTVTAAAFRGDGAVPRGVIVMWSGNTGSIPAWWVLCDGQNGAPNLLDRFVLGPGVEGP